MQPLHLPTPEALAFLGILREIHPLLEPLQGILLAPLLAQCNPAISRDTVIFLVYVDYRKFLPLPILLRHPQQLAERAEGSDQETDRRQQDVGVTQGKLDVSSPCLEGPVRRRVFQLLE